MQPLSSKMAKFISKTDIREAVFMLVDEQIDADDVVVNEAYPVVIEAQE